MRRIAKGAALLAALGCLGCRSMRTPWDSAQKAPEPGSPIGAPIPRGEAVPDSVMLRDQAQGGFDQSPVGP